MPLGTLIGLGCVVAAFVIGVVHMCQQERTICAVCGLAYCDGVACEIDAALHNQAVCVPAGMDAELLAPWCAFVESLEW